MICQVIVGIVRDSLISNELLSGRQPGFVCGRSCVTNLLATLKDWTSLLDSGSSVEAIYQEFSKAFDSVPRERLKVKLRALGVQGERLAWTYDFLTNRCQRVCVIGQLSDWACLICGVLQGRLFGPSLFAAFIKDLPETVSRLCSICTRGFMQNVFDNYATLFYNLKLCKTAPKLTRITQTVQKY